MYKTTIKKARRDLSSLISSCIEFDEVIDIVTNKGNVILINQNMYDELLSSLSLLTNKELMNDIRIANNTSTREFYKHAPWE